MNAQDAGDLAQTSRRTQALVRQFMQGDGWAELHQGGAAIDQGTYKALEATSNLPGFSKLSNWKVVK